MKKQRFLFCLFSFALLCMAAFSQSNAKLNRTIKAQAQQSMKNQPIGFIENKGQMAGVDGKPVPSVLFRTSAPGTEMYVTQAGLTYVFLKFEEEEHEGKVAEKEERNEPATGKEKREEHESNTIEWSRVDMGLNGANIQKENIIKESPSLTDYNYFFGHCPEGIYGIKQFEKITIKNVYPGIDWVLYNSNKEGFKYDFIVHTGADPKQIELIYSSLKPLKIDRGGNIIVKTETGTLTESAPISFSDEKKIETHFIKTLNQKNNKGGYDTHIQFSLEEYDPAQTLIIDPKLGWATLYGAPSGVGYTGLTTVDCDANGNLFAAGYTFASNLFLVNAGTYYNGTHPGFDALIILKFNSLGQLVWATYYGGSSNQWPEFLKTDANGNLFITGHTRSTNFPTQNALGGTYFKGTNPNWEDAFILKFDNAGNRKWASYFGGSYDDFAHCLAIDNSGNVFITGETNNYGASTFPVLNAGGYFQNTPTSSTNGFVAKFNNSGVLLWSTFLRGATVNNGASSICVDNSGNIAVTGWIYNATATGFPLVNSGGYFDNTTGKSTDIFISKFNSSTNMTWSTYFGGTLEDFSYSSTFDKSGNLFIAGSTTSLNFPTQAFPGGYNDNSFNGGTDDVFITKFDPGNNLLWSSYFGGSDKDFAVAGNGIYDRDRFEVDNCNNIYYALTPQSANLPLVDPGCSSYFDNSCNGCDNNNSTNPSEYPGDQFITRFSSNCVLTWATYFGGGNNIDLRASVALDKNNNLYIAGEWFGQASMGGGTYPFMDQGGGAYFNNTFGADGDISFIAKFIPTPATYTSTQVNNTSCAICNGSATINVSCGNPNYNYVWSNGSQTLSTTSTTNTITGLCAGTYTVTAYFNCDTIKATYTLTGTNCGCNLSTTLSASNVSCGSTNNGSATATATGGSAPYTYSWSNGSSSITGSATSQLPNLTQGIYTVTVTDVNGCSSISSVTIKSSLAAQFIKGTAGCTGCGCKEWIMITASGGNNPYTYIWSGGYDKRYRNKLCPGNYTMQVVDKNGCSVNINLSTP
jgi:hypothetical protein